MSRETKAGERTFDTVRRKYDEWIEIRSPAPPRERSYPDGPTMGDTMSKFVLTAIGVGIGLTLLAMAAYTFWSATQWTGYARDGAATGYALVGFFLTIAGVGGIFATWNHNFRVLDPDRKPSAHH